MTKRLFIALPIPTDEQKRLAEIQLELVRISENIRCPRARNLHLTLKFLGNVDDDMVDSIGEALFRVANNVPRFDWSLKGLGNFPKRGAPRVVSIGVDEGKAEITVLNDLIESECVQFGFARGNAIFSPHVTLARIKRRWKSTATDSQKSDIANLSKFIDHYRTGSSQPLPGDRIILYRSVLSTDGALYTPLVEVPLCPES